MIQVDCLHIQTKFQNICAGQPRAFHRDVTDAHDLEAVVAAIFLVFQGNHCGERR